MAQPGETASEIWTTRTVRTFARVRAGRLVEARVGRLASLADIESLSSAFSAALGIAGASAMVCADYRCASTLLPRDLADTWSRSMRRHNRNVDRSALVLHPENMTFNLQIERVVQCAGHERRRVFTDLDDVHAWLDGDLTVAERAALRVFLSEGPEESRCDRG